MSRKLLLLAALPLLFTGPAVAVAQSSDQAPAATETPAPPPADAPAATTDEPATGEAGTEPAAGADEPMTGDAGAEGTATEGTAEMDAAPDAATSTAATGDAEILTEESGDQVLADRLLGMPVVDMAGEEIGEVDDILLNKSGEVAGLVLTTGQVLGLGGKTIAVSWQDVSSAENAESITLNLTEEQLAAAPEFRTKEEVESEQMENTAPAAGGVTPTPDPAAPPAPAEQ